MAGSLALLIKKHFTYDISKYPYSSVHVKSCCRSAKSLSLHDLLKYLAKDIAHLIQNLGMERNCQNPFTIILTLKQMGAIKLEWGGGAKDFHLN